MSKPQTWLSAVLGFQLLLAGGLYLHGRQAQTQHSQQAAILEFDKAAVDKVIVSDESGKAILVKSEQGWELPEYQKLPADGARLEQLLATLSELKSSWPVGTSTDSHELFEVSEEKFARKIELWSQDKPAAELYLGSSPGFRKTHVRNPEANEVHAAAISTSDAAASDDSWLDRSLLASSAPTAIQSEQFELKKEGESWKLERGEGSLNAAHTEGFLSALNSLQVSSLEAKTPAMVPSWKLEVLDGGKTLRYDFWLEGDKVTVRRSDRDQAFSLPKSTYDLLRSYDLAKLTEAP